MSIFDIHVCYYVELLYSSIFFIYNVYYILGKPAQASSLKLACQIGSAWKTHYYVQLTYTMNKYLP